MASIRRGAHTIYLGHKVQGSMGTVFAKCTCSAFLQGQAAIDEHVAMADAESGAVPLSA